VQQVEPVRADLQNICMLSDYESFQTGLKGFEFSIQPLQSI